MGFHVLHHILHVQIAHSENAGWFRETAVHRMRTIRPLHVHFLLAFVLHICARARAALSVWRNTAERWFHNCILQPGCRKWFAQHFSLNVDSGVCVHTKNRVPQLCTNANVYAFVWVIIQRRNYLHKKQPFCTYIKPTNTHMCMNGLFEVFSNVAICRYIAN